MATNANDVDGTKVALDERKYKLDRWKVAFSAVSGVLVPLAICTVGLLYQSSQNQSIGAEYAGMAVEILRSDPNDTGEDLRRWALDVLNAGSAVKLGAAAERELQSGKLPISAGDEPDNGQ